MFDLGGINTKRLLKLATLLEKDAKTKKGVQFDLGVWAMTETAPKDKKVPVTCGTQACAFGLAAISGKFKDEGLEYSVDKALDEDGKEVFHVHPWYKGRRDMMAAVAFFNITERQADSLFLPDAYEKSEGAKAELAVAARIRNFVTFITAWKGLSKLKDSGLFLNDLDD